MEKAKQRKIDKMQFSTELQKYELTVEEFKEMRQEEKDYVLLDVRQKWEIDKARLDPHLHIPLEDLIENIYKIPHNTSVIVMCHRGVRSLKACVILMKFGVARVKSLKGGIEEWSRKIDPSIPHYTKV